MNKYTLFLVIIITICLTSILSFEDQTTLKRREDFYSHINEFSNNNIKLGKSQIKGLSCIANKYIAPKDEIFRVKKEYSLCSFDLFPFKNEFIEILNRTKIVNTINKDQKYSGILLTYFILYLLHADKEILKEYITKRGMSEYYNTFEPNESIAKSFPDFVPNFTGYSTKEYFILETLGYLKDELKETSAIFQTFNNELTGHKHSEALYPWTSNFEQFQHAYSIALSRGKTLTLDNYMKLSNLSVSKLTIIEKKNYQLNTYFGKAMGGTCIVSYVDLCNHYQPKYPDLRDSVVLTLDTENGYFSVKATKAYRSGQEVTFTYQTVPVNVDLYNKYGFSERNNQFNAIPLRVDDKKVFSQKQSSLLKELNCFYDGVYKQDNKIMSRNFILPNGKLDERLLNYSRVSFISDNFDTKEFKKTLDNKGKVSFNNEIQSLTYYLSTIDSKIAEMGKRYYESIKQIQLARNKLKQIVSRWNKKKDQKELKGQTYRKLIHEFDLYNLDIAPKQKVLVSNEAIKHVNNEITKLKKKYTS